MEFHKKYESQPGEINKNLKINKQINPYLLKKKIKTKLFILLQSTSTSEFMVPKFIVFSVIYHYNIAL